MASIGTTTLEGYVDMTAVGNPHGEQFKVTKFSGALAWLSWHSVYLLLRQKSWKNRLLICMYWFKVIFAALLAHAPDYLSRTAIPLSHKVRICVP